MRASIFREIWLMRQEGRIHSPFLTHIRTLFVICLVLGGIVIYNLATRGASIVIAATLAAIGFAIGLFVFSRMNAAKWTEKESDTETSRMDEFGLIVLGTYVAFEVGLRVFFAQEPAGPTTVFLLSGILGALAGRAVGSLVEIHRVYTAVHEKTETIFEDPDPDTP